ncbi:hypothetical protein GJAV_G00234540 [Gymnothorax javanicus]|nr:hypothetical protein GJAV_G00234540 [Gymnothorax javanicus]
MRDVMTADCQALLVDCFSNRSLLQPFCAYLTGRGQFLPQRRERERSDSESWRRARLNPSAVARLISTACLDPFQLRWISLCYEDVFVKPLPRCDTGSLAGSHGLFSEHYKRGSGKFALSELQGL